MKKKFLYLILLGIGMSIQNKSFAMNDNKSLNPISFGIEEEFYDLIVEKLQKKANEETENYLENIMEIIKLLPYAEVRFISVSDQALPEIVRYTNLISEKFDELFSGIREQYPIKNLKPFGINSYERINNDIEYVNMKKTIPELLIKYPDESDLKKIHRNFFHFVYVENEVFHKTYNQLTELDYLIDEVDTKYNNTIENQDSKIMYEEKFMIFNNVLIKGLEDIGYIKK